MLYKFWYVFFLFILFFISYHFLLFFWLDLFLLHDGNDQLINFECFCFFWTKTENWMSKNTTANTVIVCLKLQRLSSYVYPVWSWIHLFHLQNLWIWLYIYIFYNCSLELDWVTGRSGFTSYTQQKATRVLFTNRTKPNLSETLQAEYKNFRVLKGGNRSTFLISSISN